MISLAEKPPSVDFSDETAKETCCCGCFSAFMEEMKQ